NINDLSFSKTGFFHDDLYKLKGRKSNYSCLILGEVDTSSNTSLRRRTITHLPPLYCFSTD
ncbi:hypothetical protein, partial [Proteus mirabilis]|uniref:hypothetical protein n=1 Tax=Proteus mirabilis TaxID=584 RepID=UPI003F4ABCE1